MQDDFTKLKNQPSQDVTETAPEVPAQSVPIKIMESPIQEVVTDEAIVSEQSTDVAQDEQTPETAPLDPSDDSHVVSEETHAQLGEQPAEPQPIEASAQDQFQPEHNKHGAPTPIIIIAVVICLSLVGVAIYLALNQTDSKKAKKVQNVTSQQTQATTQQAPVNTTKDDINTAVNEATQLPTTTEDPSAGVSSQNLGL